MACELNSIKPYFMVEVVSRFSTKYGVHDYIFVGEQNEDTMENLERLSKLDKKSKDYNDLKIIFGENNLNLWTKTMENSKIKHNLHFVKSLINMDDNLNEVKKKIFVYCPSYTVGQKGKEEYILPSNQELWLKIKTKKEISEAPKKYDFKMLGYHYIEKGSEEKYQYKPHIYENFEIDTKLFPYLKHQINMNNNNTKEKSKNYEEKEEDNNSSKSKNYVRKKEYKIDTGDNYLLLFDIFDNDNVHDNNIIYVSNVKDEILYLKLKLKKEWESKKNNIFKGYIKKYWPAFNEKELDKDKKQIENLQKIYLKGLQREQYINNLMNTLIIDSSMFDCSIKTIKFNVNYDEDELVVDDTFETSIDEFYKENNDYVDLYQLFDYIRDKRMGDNLPFIKYGDVTIDEPFMVISLDAVNQNRLPKHLLKDWVGLTKLEDRRFNGLQIKSFIKNYGPEYKYNSIKMLRNGTITFTVSYSAENQAKLNDVVLAVKNCKKLIDDINTHIPDYRLIRSVDERKRIQSPDMSLENGIVKFKKNTKMTFLNLTITMNLPKQIDFKKLKEFSELFTNYLAEEPKTKQNEAIVQNSLKLRYKRVSSFANMSEIMAKISKMMDIGQSDMLIKDMIMKNYDKTEQEAENYLLQYKRKYAVLGKGKIDTTFKLGVRVQIFQDKILFDGITKIYQVPEIYKFFTTFIYVFMYLERFEKNKDFEKQIYRMNTQIEEQMNIERDINLIDEDDLKIIQGVQNNSNFFNNGFGDASSSKLLSYMSKYDTEEDLESEENKIERYVSKMGTMLAKEEDIDPNIRLECEDKVVEVQTCQDFCNDSRYFIRRLQLYDNILFKFNVLKKAGEAQYSRSCQGSNNQPIILDFDPSSDPRIKRESYSYSIKYSSDPGLFQRWYICPKIWCPYCQIPISEEDIDKRTITKKLMTKGDKECITAICPYGDHQVFIRDPNIMTFDEEKKFKEELKKLKSDKEREKMIREYQENSKYAAYPGFSPKKHPKGYCLPCCFTRPHNVKGSAFYSSYLRCLGEEVDDDDKQDGLIYIKKFRPVDKNRYGVLSGHVAKVLNTTIETGPLGNKKGYFRRGVKQTENNSFLSTIADIFSCDKQTNTLTVEKIKKILIDKLDDKLFRSLHGGNLVHIFNDKTKNTTPLQNFIYYLNHHDIEINHTFLWDLLQRPNILYEDGVNIFIFDDNTMLCPVGEKVDEFYKKNRKNIIIAKHKKFYEPVYHLEGSNDGKTVKFKCIFDYTRPEIKKIHEIAQEGCTEESIYKWNEILQNTMKQHQVKINTQKLDLGLTLEKTLEKILTAINDNKLKDSFTPVIQYVDGYNKVFAIGLRNKTFLPVAPSKIMTEFAFKDLINLEDIDYLNYLDTKKNLDELNQKTNIQCNVVKKVIDKRQKNPQYGMIVAVLLDNDRLVPVSKSKDTNKSINVADFNFYTDIDYYIFHKYDSIPDERVEIINKKNYEEESYQRLRFEISRFIQQKSEREYKQKIEEILNMETKDLHIKRNFLYKVLKELFDKLVIIGTEGIDYNYYIRPNKRVPCFQRATLKDENNKNNSKNKDYNSSFELSCDDDPHCKVSFISNNGTKSKNGKCKLYINEYNLLEKKRKNEEFYLDRIIEELLRYPLKRDEIIYDNISPIINKDLVVVNKNKYVLIHGEDYIELDNIIDNIYLDKKGIILNKSPLFEEQSNRKNVSFKHDEYFVTKSKLINSSMIRDLPIYWNNYLGNTFKVVTNIEDSLFVSISYALKQLETNNNIGKEITPLMIKELLVQYLDKVSKDKNIIAKIADAFDEDIKNNNSNLNIKNNKKHSNKKTKPTLRNNMSNENIKKYDENTIYLLYKNQCKKLLAHVQSYSQLSQELLSNNHKGCEVDILLLSNKFNINIIILEERKKRDLPTFYCVGSQFGNFNKYIILMRNIQLEKNIYNILENKNKFVFEDVDLPYKFREEIVDKCKLHTKLCYQC